MKLTREELVLASSIFILIFGMNRNSKGNRIRKKIYMGIKKVIAYNRQYYSREENIKIVTEGRNIIDSANMKCVLENIDFSKHMRLKPTALLRRLEIAIPNSLEKIGIDYDLFLEWEPYFDDVPFTFRTIVYTNRLIEDSCIN